MMWLIKMIFCRHKEIEFRRNIHGDEINHTGGMRSMWKCKRCDKFIYKKELLEIN